MKISLFPLLLLISLLAISPVHAKTQYVSDELRVPLRKTPCDRCKIIHHGLPSGTALTIIKTNSEGWSQVKTKGGMDGWLPSRYLQSQQIARYRIVVVEKELAAAKEKNQTLNEQLKAVVKEKLAIEQQLGQELSTKEGISSELNDIRKLSANAISIHQQNQELLTKNNMLQGQLDILSATNKQLQTDRSQGWFLYGALAVFMGAVLAVLLPRLKRRKKFSEWG